MKDILIVLAVLAGCFVVAMLIMCAWAYAIGTAIGHAVSSRPPQEERRG